MILHPITTRTLLAAPDPPVLVQDLISRFGVTGVSADPGVGKTFLALELGRAVVTGTPFLGQFPVEQGAVLFVGQDASLMEYARQLRKTIHLPYAENAEPFDDRLSFIIHAGLDLGDATHAQALATAANRIEHSWEGEARTLLVPDPETGEVEQITLLPTKRGVSLIVLDTLSFFHHMNENDNAQMNVVFHNLRALADQTKAAVVVLHHHSYGTEQNPGGRWRGASAQLAALDGHLKLTRSNNVDEVWLSIEKFRGVRVPNFAYAFKTDHETATMTFLGERGETDPWVADVREWIDTTNHQVFESKHIVAMLALKYVMVDRKSIESRVSKMLTSMKNNGSLQSPARGLWFAIKKEEPHAV